MPIFWGGSEGLNEERKTLVFSERMKDQFSNYNSWDSIKSIHRRYIVNGGRKSNGLKWMSYLDLNLRLPELLLMRVDKMSMGVSLESRVPFLDHRLIDRLAGVSFDWKMGSTFKSSLKRVFSKIVPKDIIKREKMGFPVPISYEGWIEKNLEMFN